METFWAVLGIALAVFGLFLLCRYAWVALSGRYEKVNARLAKVLDKNGNDVLEEYKIESMRIAELFGGAEADPSDVFESEEYGRFFEKAVSNGPYRALWEYENYWFVGDAMDFDGPISIRIIFDCYFVIDKGFKVIYDKKNPFKHYGHMQYPLPAGTANIQGYGYTIAEKGSDLNSFLKGEKSL